MHHVEEAQCHGSRTPGDWPTRHAHIARGEVVDVVGRVRDDGSRLRRMGPLQGTPARTGRQARSILLRLGEDRAGEGRLRLRLARSAHSRMRGDGREALGLRLLRESRLGQRLPARDAREPGDGRSRGLRRLAPLHESPRRTLPGRGGRMGDLERAVRTRGGVRGAVLPHGAGDPRGPADGEVLLHGDHLERARSDGERLRRRAGET